MTDKLTLYNKASRHLGQRKLASLTENGELRRYLDDEYDSTVLYCLEQGLWNFAMRTAAFTSTPSLQPPFGYQNAFTKPLDWIRTADFAEDEYFTLPCRRYSDEVGFWFADIDTLYVKYVSSDPDFGLNLLGWPETFAEYVGCQLAFHTCYRVAQAAELSDVIEKRLKRFRIDARSKDAMNEPADAPPTGTWVMSRRIRGGLSTPSGNIGR